MNQWNQWNQWKRIVILLACVIVLTTGCGLDVMTKFERWSLDPVIAARIRELDEAFEAGKPVEHYVSNLADLTHDQMRFELYYLLRHLELAGTDQISNARLNDASPMKDLDQWMIELDQIQSMDQYYRFLKKVSEAYQPLYTRVLHPGKVLEGLPALESLEQAKSVLPQEVIWETYNGYRNKPQVLLNNQQLLQRFENKSGLEYHSDLFEREEVVSTGVAEDGKTAYLKIASFQIRGTAPDGTVLGVKDFLSSLYKFDTLIIDVRGNHSLDISPWRDEIVARLVKVPARIQTYIAFRRTAPGEAMRQELLTQFSFEAGRLLYDASRGSRTSAANLALDGTPQSPVSMNQVIYDDRQQLGDYVRIRDVVTPRDPVNFKGKIYLLTDSQVYGSADLFSFYLKQLDLAELVGKQNRGDGIAQTFGFYRMPLPYSGIVFQIQMAYGFNKDGSPNHDRGTTIDVARENGEELEYALKQSIRKIQPEP
ncbi:MAG: S41 family peptidase [Clostridiaceae bacterium]